MSDNAETAILSGGCAWVMQQLLRHPNGVISTRVGWTGGEGDNPTEDSPGGHAEAVEVVFDPERISFRDLLEYFFQVHRPDLDEHLVGSIYRSEIFCSSDEQRRTAEETIRDVDASGPLAGEDPDEDQRCRPLLAERAIGSGLLPALSGLSGRRQVAIPAAKRETGHALGHSPAPGLSGCRGRPRVDGSAAAETELIDPVDAQEDADGAAGGGRRRDAGATNGHGRDRAERTIRSGMGSG